MDHQELDLTQFIRDVPDFPKEGILFKDITPLLQDPVALRYAVDHLVEFGTGKKLDMVLGAESRGFILGPAVAYGLGAGLRSGAQTGQAALADGPRRVRSGIRYRRPGDAHRRHPTRAAGPHP